jgi:hypothetical protein
MDNDNLINIDDYTHFGDLGPSVPLRSNKKQPQQTTLPQISNDDVINFLQKIKDRMATCSTQREILEQELTEITECLGIATEMYKMTPVPDYAYSLAALANTHRSFLAQLEKMMDPKTIMNGLNDIIQEMFVKIVRSMTEEITKTKNELGSLDPKMKATVEESFKRMVDSIQPGTQKLFDDLESSLKKTLGIKG